MKELRKIEEARQRQQEAKSEVTASARPCRKLTFFDG